jgi:dTMP kinase
MKRGIFIVLEGIDGTGKSTQARALANHLESHGHSVVLSREPTDGPWGKKLRESAETGRLSAHEELDYFLRDRHHHVTELILPSLAQGSSVVLDRYYFSTMAYQGARGLDPREIRCRNEAFAPPPDLLIILDLDVDTALRRIGSRGDSANEFEERATLQICRDIFRSLQSEPYCCVIDASGTLESVTAALLDVVEARMAGELSSLPPVED